MSARDDLINHFASVLYENHYSDTGKDWHHASPDEVTEWRGIAAAKVDAVRDEARLETPALPGILRGAADRIDAEDLPQTAGDTADFHDGARWATTQLRQVADEAAAGPAGDATPDWLVDIARRYAPAALTDAERAMLRYALDLVDDRIASEGDEFTEADRAAAVSLRDLVPQE